MSEKIYFIIICLIVFLVMISYLKRYINKKVSLSEFETHRMEFNKLIIDIERITDRDLQLVEERIKKCRNFLVESDKIIADIKNAFPDCRYCHNEIEDN